MCLCAMRVDLLGGDAGLDVRRKQVEHLGRQPARDAHAGEVFGGFECDRHGRDYPTGVIRHHWGSSGKAAKVPGAAP